MKSTDKTRLQRLAFRPGLLTAVGVAVSLAATELDVATAENVSAEPRLVRHQLVASIRREASLLNSNHDSPSASVGTIIIKVRISDHARETQFYGDVAASFVDFNADQGSSQDTIWEDTQCHHERGIPKATVILIEGVVKSGETQTAISAYSRRLGLRVPADEITAGKRLASGTDTRGAFTVTRVETRQSHLIVDLRLYTLECRR